MIEKIVIEGANRVTGRKLGIQIRGFRPKQGGDVEVFLPYGETEGAVLERDLARVKACEGSLLYVDNESRSLYFVTKSGNEPVPIDPTKIIPPDPVPESKL